MWTSRTVRFFNHNTLSNLSCTSPLVSRSLSGYAAQNSNVYNHRNSGFSDIHSNNYLTRKTLGCLPICLNQNSSVFRVPSGTRGIVIGRLFNWASGLSFGDLNSALDAFNHSAIVTSARDAYLWVNSAYDLPWWVNIVITTVIIRTFLYLPAAAYLERWSASKERFSLDAVPVTARLRAAAGNQERVRELLRIKKQLIAEHNCQTYKFLLGLLWQMTTVITLSAGLRQCLLTFGGSGLRNSTLPWGAELGFPDTLYILPIVNILLNFLLIEMDLWRRTKGNEELHLSLKRSKMEAHMQHVNKSQNRAFIVRRVSCVFLLVIYLSVPASLTLLWSVMLIQTIGFKFALLHPRVRMFLGIPERCYETSQPSRDFMLFLGRHIRSNPILKQLPSTKEK